MTTSNILSLNTETVELDALKPYPKNPRVGNTALIVTSLKEHGQYRPLIVQRSTGMVLAGNHTLKAARELKWKTVAVNYIDVDDEQATRIVLMDNRSQDTATYNADLLAEVLAGLDNPAGTGYSDEDYASLVKSVTEQVPAANIEDILRPPITVTQHEEGGFEAADNSAPPVLGDPTASFGDAEADAEAGDPDPEDLRDELGELQGILQLKEDFKFPGSNYYGIPDLLPKGLMQVLPKPIDTWAGEEATPDDGQTTWVWNYGVAPRKGLPMDRAILCFYTYDTYFESFWEHPAFMTAKVINAGIKYAVVPDFSFYDNMSVATWIYNTFRAQWLGRYFQEAGLTVIPRIQFGIDKADSASLDFCLSGIPKHAPVVAKCSHNSDSKESFDWDVQGLGKCLQKIQPKQLLMYGGNPALRVIEALKPVENGMCDEVVHVYNYAHKRRGVVFDKKEGLAGRKKDKMRAKRDKSDEGDNPIESKVEEANEAADAEL